MKSFWLVGILPSRMNLSISCLHVCEWDTQEFPRTVHKRFVSNLFLFCHMTVMNSTIWLHNNRMTCPVYDFTICGGCHNGLKTILDCQSGFETPGLFRTLVATLQFMYIHSSDWIKRLVYKHLACFTAVITAFLLHSRFIYTNIWSNIWPLIHGH
jgi:hypothetical protein